MRGPVHFSTLAVQSLDPILAMLDAIARDPRNGKIDLTLGVFRDEAGQTPVMRAVSQAEGLLLSEQFTKSYIGVEGDREFIEALQNLLLRPFAQTRAIGGLQAVGGTGALRLALDLIKLDRPESCVWFGTPTWPNHRSLIVASGLQWGSFRHADPVAGTIDEAGIHDAIDRASQGDTFILHGCCHNPTGIDMDDEAWRAIGVRLAAKNILPIVDIAYHGLADGLAEDLSGLHALIEEVPMALVAYSCSKNFALYRERVGALFVLGAKATVDLACSNLVPIARASYSMPPAHGAATVRTILQSPALRQDWESELRELRARVVQLRQALAAAGQAGPVLLTPLARQKGFFSMVDVTPKQAAQLREDHGIYVVPSGRMNIAGLRVADVDRLVAAFGELR